MTRLDDAKAGEAAFLLLERALSRPGFSAPSAWGFVGEAELRRLCAALPPESRQALGIDSSRSALIAALAYSAGPAEPPDWARAWPGPLAGIARFARANWYQEMSSRLKNIACAVSEDLRREGIEPGLAGDWRRFANSRLPERPLALAAGLGSLGRHGLLIAREPGGPRPDATWMPAIPAKRGGEALGPGVVLGVLLLPFAIPEAELASLRNGDQPPATARLCGTCRACVEACPTGALDGSVGADGRPGFERKRCLQHWSALPGDLPPDIAASWGRRLYGCDRCLEACPWFAESRSETCGRGTLGPGLPAAWLAEAGEGELRARLAGTALGLRWMSLDAFARNGRLALFDETEGKL